MQNKTKINTFLVVVLAILLLGLIANFVIKNISKKGPNIYEAEVIPDITKSTIYKDDLNTINVAESGIENVKNQPGTVKSVISVPGGWNLSVDYLSYNNNWQPGGNGSTGDFFVNLNPKLRTLFLANNSNDLVFKCGTETIPNVPYLNTSTYVNELNNYLIDGGYTNYYFDVKDGNITAIYQQCLP